VHVNEFTPSMQEPPLRQGLGLQSLMLVAQLLPVNPGRHWHWPLISCEFPPQAQLLMETAGLVVVIVPDGQGVQIPLPVAFLKDIGGHAAHDAVALENVNPGRHTHAEALLLGNEFTEQVVQAWLPESGLAVPLGHRAHKPKKRV
jgi:hypothetical protein